MQCNANAMLIVVSLTNSLPFFFKTWQLSTSSDLFFSLCVCIPTHTNTHRHKTFKNFPPEKKMEKKTFHKHYPFIPPRPPPPPPLPLN
ncbi:hypothetical protein DM02DRAFT_85778 [Periconia macrospinosa]|uniref:Uncharacterized protein n=1 Tax=Periconia macrospinosa TaxID=97972 RepID=A0A2V1DGN7_9PLEO|nr:hypothetical protein DM02DRAFT_85778 [Periconia macrospinosa]